ncbi:MAG: histidine phosphatase family protein [Saprospiraceae bacterium]|nr:histidine phosphatase family protein [Saprospiraceae bacterium]
MTLYIIRHGETALNRQNIVQGSGVDSDLNAVGRRQAQSFFNYYQNITFDLVVTSALKRTHQTVEPFLHHYRLKKSSIFDVNTTKLSDFKERKWVQLRELNEISWGINEGKTANPESEVHFKKLMEDWSSGVYESRVEGGESAAELRERTQKFVDFIKTQSDKKNILVCTHGRTLLCLLTILNETSLSKMNHFKHQNTGLYKIHLLDDEFIFELENDTRHL